MKIAEDIVHIFRLLCHEPDCNRPWAQIYNGTMIVASRHGGQNHSNVIAISHLLALLRGSIQARSESEVRQLLSQFNLPIIVDVENK